jgi:DNA-binding transcriptional LysR family regulator
LARAGSRPCCPNSFRYPDIAVDLHLTDARTDLIGDGFDAALRIAVMEDSSLVARLIVTDWSLPEGGLYFVTPTARARPAKVAALADFLIAELTDARWSAEAVMGWKPPARRRKRA